MDNWDEIRTAFQVARLGTVSGAADVLGVHHATVIRHIDALEGRLGVKLFQRHARGYTSTEAGQDLLRVAQTTDEQFAQLEGRIKGQGEGVTGELVVTSLVSLAPLLAPILQSFQEMHPEVIIRFLTGDRVFRLEYGEAHVAIRAGAAPDQPDNVVQPFYSTRMGMFASKAYVAKYGTPTSDEDLENHWFVAHDNEDSRAPYFMWLRERVSNKTIRFRSIDAWTLEMAIRVGSGIGFMPVIEARKDPNLVQIKTSKDEWAGPLWLVTHVDLHRTTKVQAFLTHLKAEAKAWET
ncbi:MAG: LysR family transcriptional regulator [Pseudomonadota bacterium]